MSAVNPYAPPQAAVADVQEQGEGFQPVKVWSSRGRVGRLRYLAHSTGAYLVMLPIIFVLTFALSFVGAGREGVAAAVGFLAGGAYLVFFALKTIQRSHDMDWSGWMSLLALIPLVGLIWIFKGGTERGNRFGAPPPPNSLGVKILGLLFPVIMVIGILAAIALPAYQDYTKRAKAAQIR